MCGTYFHQGAHEGIQTFWSFRELIIKAKSAYNDTFLVFLDKAISVHEEHHQNCFSVDGVISLLKVKAWASLCCLTPGSAGQSQKLCLLQVTSLQARLLWKNMGFCCLVKKLHVPHCFSTTMRTKMPSTIRTACSPSSFPPLSWQTWDPFTPAILDQTFLRTVSKAQK